MWGSTMFWRKRKHNIHLLHVETDEDRLYNNLTYLDVKRLLGL